jgi:hypothetical protein
MIVLDVSRHPPVKATTTTPALTSDEAYRLCRQVADSLVTQKILYSPRDLVGLLFAGTDATLNRLATGAPGRYRHLTVVKPPMCPTADFLTALEEEGRATQGGSCDVLESIVTALDSLHEAVGTRRYRRRVFLITSAAGRVQRKGDLEGIVESMKRTGTSLVVVGVGFSPEEAPAADVDWRALGLKEQNERVLRFMCDELINTGTNDSVVVPVSDAVAAVGALRKKNVPQRVATRMLLDIGGDAPGALRLPVCF